MKKLVLALAFIFMLCGFSYSGIKDDVCVGSYYLYSYCYQQAMQTASPKVINCNAFTLIISSKIFTSLKADVPVIAFFEATTHRLVTEICYLSCLHWKAGLLWKKKEFEFNICKKIGL